MPDIRAYGTWPSPITRSMLTEAAVGLSQVQVHDEEVWWNESRPSEAGRQALVSSPLAGGEVIERLSVPWSARTAVHEYGGRCWTVHGDTLVFSNWADQRLWAMRNGGEPQALTPAPPEPRAWRYADPVVTPDGRWVICVRERHEGAEVTNDLVAVTLDGGDEPVPLAAGRDFYAAPRISPDGTRLAWLCWDHPDMPWDHTELREAPFDAAPAGPGGRGQRPRLGDDRLVAGQPGESITQPRWSASGVLHYVSDRTGWYNLYADGGEPLAPASAEFAGPDWVFGESTYTFLPDGRIVATWRGADGSAQLGLVGASGPQPLDLPFSQYAYLDGSGGEVVGVAGSPTSPPAVVRIGADDASVAVLRASQQVPVDAAMLSRPRLVSYKSGGETARAWFYPPTNPAYEAPAEERPPLVVMSHGGPTSSASTVLSLGVQYWTSRGFAVANVDYRGSSGYGRAYRDRLRGEWGVLDVEDCSAVVEFLAGEDLADGTRAVIRGGSAGGYTTLAALCFTDVFAAGASLYGVADLELLARDTHKFEARYLDRLVGPWPEAADRYRERSPLYHLEGLRCPVILFQGEEDAVVPRAQADTIYAALTKRGVPVAYVLFPGEQHGFRQAATIEAVAEAELAFYGRVLGFTPAGDPVVPPIANEWALSLRS